MVTLSGAWQLVGTVMDPEVPVISIVELGIVRDVDATASGYRVTITPTYSGCPAMDAIREDLCRAFAHEGAEVEVVTTLAPAWTTDWMAPEGRARLAAFGIAPPPGATVHRHGGAATIDVSKLRSPPRPSLSPACPRCGSANTSRISQFASTACKALYRCDDCREPFDFFKPH